MEEGQLDAVSTLTALIRLTPKVVFHVSTRKQNGVWYQKHDYNGLAEKSMCLFFFPDVLAFIFSSSVLHIVIGTSFTV